MSIFGFIRVGMKKEKVNADMDELKLKEVKKENGISEEQGVKSLK